MTSPTDVIPTAQDFARRLAAVRAEEEALAEEKRKAAEAEKRALIELYQKPSGIPDEEGVRRGLRIIERAVNNGLTEVQFYRFPNSLCSDHGRAINQGEPGWPDTLTGVPREIFALWDKYFRPKGYRLEARVVDYPDGVPGDIGMTLKWS